MKPKSPLLLQLACICATFVTLSASPLHSKLNSRNANIKALVYLGICENNVFYTDPAIRGNQSEARDHCSSLGLELATFTSVTQLNCVRAKLPNGYPAWTDGENYQNANGYLSGGSFIVSSITVTGDARVGVLINAETTYLVSEYSNAKNFLVCMV